MSSINYSEKIPNNVNLSEDRTLQRALEQWQPNYLQWWGDMGPDGSQNFDVYLRTAISVDPQGWAQFGHVKMPDYRWGLFLASPSKSTQKEGDPLPLISFVAQVCWASIGNSPKNWLKQPLAEIPHQTCAPRRGRRGLGV